MNYSQLHLNETIKIIENIDIFTIERMVDIILKVKNNRARIFFFGGWWKRSKLLSCCK